MNNKTKYSLYFGNLKDEVILILIKTTAKSISIKSQTIMQNKISDSLLIHVRQFLSQNSLTKNDLSAIYINHGPSKFNADRLLTLTTKTLACFQNIPLYVISNLKLHLLYAKANAIIIEDNSNNFYLAHVEKQKLIEVYLPKSELDHYLEQKQIKPNKITWMNLEEHKVAVLENLNNFHLVLEPALLKTNYVKDPLRIRKNENE
ncbi:hypothetical protein MCAV_07330 [[Mycoplasma] cavipharyngis]|uniref:hypothetical protein n=1 Tax=[Mycoplasma] cavipharyngis TaxID=92757 RepID=UPI003703C11F